MIRGKQLLLLLALSFAWPSLSLAQENPASKALNNTAYFELLGNAFLYSLNYERTLLKYNEYSFSGRIGISYYNIGFQADGFGMAMRYRFFPLTFNMIRHFNRNNIEVGIGTVNEFSNAYKEDITYIPIPTFHAGYRRYMKNNIDFRVGINLSKVDAGSGSNFDVFPWPYMSLGKRF